MNWKLLRDFYRRSFHTDSLKKLFETYTATRGYRSIGEEKFFIIPKTPVRVSSSTRVAILVSGNETIGFGHITRTIALSSMFSEQFSPIFFIPASDQQARIMIESAGFLVLDRLSLDGYLGSDTVLVLDGYDFSLQYQRDLKSRSKYLIVIDDFGGSDFAADVVINGAPFAHDLSYPNVNSDASPERASPRFYLGTDFALIRKPFLDFIPPSKSHPSMFLGSRVLLVLGGVDPLNISTKLVQYLKKITAETGRHLELQVVTSRLNKNLGVLQSELSALGGLRLDLDAEAMRDIIQESDVVISSASMTSLETILIRRPLFVGYVAKNQVPMAEHLGRRKAAVNLGQFSTMSLESFRESFLGTIDNLDLISAMMTAQSRIFKSNPTKNIRAIFETLA